MKLSVWVGVAALAVGGYFIFGPKEKASYVDAPQIAMPAPLDPAFENWDAWTASVGVGKADVLFMEDGKGYLGLSFESPTPIYVDEPTAEERQRLGAELLHQCKSERGRAQLAWISDWARNEKIVKSAEFVRVVVRYETAPQGAPGREKFGYEARYRFEDGTCGTLVDLHDKSFKEAGYVQFFE